MGHSAATATKAVDRDGCNQTFSATSFRYTIANSAQGHASGHFAPSNRDRTQLMEPLLLVEDKTELRTMLRKALERAGHVVDEAPDGSSAVARCAHGATCSY